MSRIAYVAGRYRPIRDAHVHIEDRGYQFADGVYEGIAVRRGKMVDMAPHLDRLDRSLNGLRMAAPMGRAALIFVLREVIRRNRTRDGFLYIQVTRGVARRDHPFPAHARPVLTVTCRRLDFDAVAARGRKGVAAKSCPDERWARCDLKTISLLPNILAKQAAREAGAFEAVMVDGEGWITEGSSTNMWIIKDNTLITRALDANILPGITRATVMTLARDRQIVIEEKPFSVHDAQNADEMFLTSSTGGVTPIVSLDGIPIGEGVPGPIGHALIDAYMAMMDTL